MCLEFGCATIEDCGAYKRAYENVGLRLMNPKQLLVSMAALLALGVLWQFAPGDGADPVRPPTVPAKPAAEAPSHSLSDSFTHRDAAPSEDDSPLARMHADLDAAKERIAELEAMVAELADAWNRFASNEEAKVRKANMRGWGPEQATGAPDSRGAGDQSTAWASLQPDGGAEWLETEFKTPVEIAQIRLLENDNPGAVVKITAQLENGSEAVLWQGNEPRAAAPADQVFPVRAGYVASSVRIHLDTAKVPGWNEIDAVELIGRDGTRQWAHGASASSTYASPRGAFPGLGENMWSRQGQLQRPQY